MNSTTRVQKIGLALGGLLSLINLITAAAPAPDGTSPPSVETQVLDGVLGVIGLVAVIAAWRGSKLAAKLAAGTLGLPLLAALPSLAGQNVTTEIQALTVAFTVVSLAALALMLSPEPQAIPASAAERRVSWRVRGRWRAR